MPEKVTREEKLLELAITKAKEVIQEAGHLGKLKLDEPLTGEEVKVTRPKENPKEVKLPETSNIEGKENKISKTSKEILKAPFDTATVASQAARADEQKLKSLLVKIIDEDHKLEQQIMESKGNKSIRIFLQREEHDQLAGAAGNLEKLEQYIRQAYNLADFSIRQNGQTWIYDFEVR
tara:strand:- start:445 stop:978 length:534 start_codon:yes stop_codon:yes gene_type:complete